MAISNYNPTTSSELQAYIDRLNNRGKPNQSGLIQFTQYTGIGNGGLVQPRPAQHVCIKHRYVSLQAPCPLKNMDC